MSLSSKLVSDQDSCKDTDVPSMEKLEEGFGAMNNGLLAMFFDRRRCLWHLIHSTPLFRELQRKVCDIDNYS